MGSTSDCAEWFTGWVQIVAEEAESTPTFEEAIDAVVRELRGRGVDFDEDRVEVEVGNRYLEDRYYRLLKFDPVKWADYFMPNVDSEHEENRGRCKKGT
jgi:hypothetical protein